MTIDNIKEEIYNAKSIIILTHEMPDGDAVGSSLAMYNALKSINKDEKWLIHQLKLKGYSDTTKILLATVDINDKLVIYEDNDNVVSKDILE